MLLTQKKEKKKKNVAPMGQLRLWQSSHGAGKSFTSPSIQSSLFL